MKQILDVYAGPQALRRLRERGLRADDVDVVAAASGGPKWIVLDGLDRFLIGEFFAERARPLQLISSSSGAWRMACWAQAEPLRALDRLGEAYIGQRYPQKPSQKLVSDTCAGIVAHLLGRNGTRDILDHPWLRLHVLTARCRGLLASDWKPLLLAGFVGATLCNLVNRRTLGWWMSRVIFHPAEPSFGWLDDLPTAHVPLTTENLAPALLATGSIPLLADGVRVPGAPAGVYRDGAVTDYHPDFEFGPGLVLYPHFFSRVVTGWLDLFAPWRRARRAHFERAVIVAPSPAWVAALPGGTIPERNDFYTSVDEVRIARWTAVRDASAELGIAFAELVRSGRIAELARPLPF